MKFRDATNDDFLKISNLISSVLQSYGLKFDPQQTDADLFDIGASFFQQGGTFQVLLNEDNKIIGTYALCPLSKDKCELRKMYLSPQFRGLGIGKKMLESALEKAKSLGFSRIELETASVLKEAIALYEKFGFRPFKADHLSQRCDQSYFLDI